MIKHGLSYSGAQAVMQVDNADRAVVVHDKQLGNVFFVHQSQRLYGQNIGADGFGDFWS